ncbi:MAG: OmpH family outer membrane protein [Bacteroidales bacterium]|nr:OmpH family outer membrane protein [Bacteroidales bacterium]
MKKLVLIAVMIFSVFAFATAQKFAYVDTDYILENIPEYNDAKALLDDLSEQWQHEIEEKYAEIDLLYKAYQAEAVLLPEDMKKKKEDEIIKKEKGVKELQRQKFGQDGELFKKRQELIKPIQEKIYNAIEEMAVQRNFAIIFDKSGSLSMLFADAKYDLSDDVLDELGYSYNTGK